MEKLFGEGLAELDVQNFSTDTLLKSHEKGEEHLLDGKKYPFKKGVQKLKASLKKAKPAKNAKVDFRGVTAELVYVPVLKTTCVFEEESYVGYVNLVNGACTSQYKTSERLDKATDKVMGQVRSARQFSASSLLFIFALCLMSFFKSWYPDWKWDPTLGWVTIVLGALMSVPVLALCWLALYKREKMKTKAVESGKLPTAIPAIIAVALGWVASIASLVLFVFKILMV